MLRDANANFCKLCHKHADLKLKRGIDEPAILRLRAKGSDS